jgi:hypothetical protein
VSQSSCVASAGWPQIQTIHGILRGQNAGFQTKTVELIEKKTEKQKKK